MLWILLWDATQTEWDPSSNATFVEEMGSEMVVEMDFGGSAVYMSWVGG